LAEMVVGEGWGGGPKGRWKNYGKYLTVLRKGIKMPESGKKRGVFL